MVEEVVVEELVVQVEVKAARLEQGGEAGSEDVGVAGLEDVGVEEAEAHMLVRGSSTPLILALRRRGPSNPNPFQP